jgi:hypothetical protein
MNDFTKEELEELMHCVYAYRDLCDEDVKENLKDNLCDKIQSLIDNYCEHEDTTQDSALVYVCNYCHRIY